MTYRDFKRLDRVEISRLELKKERTKQEVDDLIQHLKEAYAEIDRLEGEVEYIDFVY